MNVLTINVVPLVDVLEEMGITEEKAEKVIEKMTDYLDGEDALPEDQEGIVNYIEDEDMLNEMVVAGKVDKVKFFEAIAKASTENGDFPVYVTVAG